ncbi:MAG: bifunctional DNA-formamidopyrimidine glycosylase/DNA-(apurinic or apyrimidinic site) lyase [Sphingopyxis sp.]|nr:bifunctional DNA-formamidopyrimidine glycosylase/DNA-(apurinic or apyrimidinic site) lyase [Sphingopyxis sp.]
MPELPEVETTVRGLAPILSGARIARLTVTRPDLRRPFPVDLVQRMTGATITALSRRAKYGLIATDRGDTMIFHLGMSGRWRTDAGEPQLHDHLIIDTDGGRRVALNDPRRFGSVDLVDGDPASSFAPFVKLGPEPLSAAFNAQSLAVALSGRSSPVKLLLLDQRIVAGLGNIYVCEALNMALIHPARSGGTLTMPELRRLIAAVKAVLERAIAVGGSSLRDFVHPDGQLGYFSHEWRVYGRGGEACACGRKNAVITRIVQGGRSTFFCAMCQR